MRSNRIDEALYGRKYSNLVECGCKSKKPDTYSSDTFNPELQCHPEVTSISIRYEYEGQIHSLAGDSLSSFLTWTKSNTGSVLGKVFLNTSSLAKVKFTASGDNTIVVSLNDGRKLVMNEVNVLTNELKIKIEGESGRTMHYSYSTGSGMLPDLSEILRKGEVEIDFGNGATAFAVPWVLVWGAATLIAGIVDAYCDNQVAQQVAACTAKGQCSVVNTCGATCVSCGA